MLPSFMPRTLPLSAGAPHHVPRARTSQQTNVFETLPQPLLRRREHTSTSLLFQAQSLPQTGGLSTLFKHATLGCKPLFDYWLIDQEEWIGKLTLRPQINEQFLASGGHIGYEIRPSRRRRRYGTLLLRLGLEKAREQGLCRVLLTCYETNVGSKKIIEANAGRYENAVPQEGTSVKKLRYWIDLSPL